MFLSESEIFSDVIVTVSTVSWVSDQNKFEIYTHMSYTCSDLFSVIMCQIEA